MSREIDTSDLSSLSTEDLKYLHDRSQISTAQFAEAVGVSEAELKDQLKQAVEGASLSLEDRANTGNANTAGLDPDQYQRQLKANNGLSDEEEAGDEGDPAFGEEEEEQAYEDMTNDQLRAELASRKLSTSGNKEQMIARLEEDDASEEDEEDDEE